MLSIHESDRLRRVRDDITFRPRTTADASAMAIYALCGWVRERAQDEWELTDLGRQQLNNDR